MKKVIFLVVFFISFFSCNSNKIDKPKKPGNLLSKDDMVNILYDMALVNAAKGVNKKILERNGFNPKHYVFKKHNIDSLQFAESNNYYTYYPQTYENIYEKVRFKLESRKNGYKAILDEEKKERDSLTRKARERTDSISKLSKRKRDSILKKGNILKKGDPLLLKKKTSNPSENEEQLKQ